MVQKIENGTTDDSSNLSGHSKVTRSKSCWRYGECRCMTQLWKVWAVCWTCAFRMSKMYFVLVLWVCNTILRIKESTDFWRMLVTTLLLQILKNGGSFCKARVSTYIHAHCGNCKNLLSPFFWQIFRESNIFAKECTKELISRNTVLVR